MTLTSAWYMCMQSLLCFEWFVNKQNNRYIEIMTLKLAFNTNFIFSTLIVMIIFWKKYPDVCGIVQKEIYCKQEIWRKYWLFGPQNKNIFSIIPVLSVVLPASYMYICLRKRIKRNLRLLRNKICFFTELFTKGGYSQACSPPRPPPPPPPC